MNKHYRPVSQWGRQHRIHTLNGGVMLGVSRMELIFICSLERKRTYVAAVM